MISIKNRIHTAIILCGGKSTRPGFDKQLLRIGDQLIALYIAQKLNEIFDEIIIVTNRPELYCGYGYIVCTDIYKDCGPIAGIHAGLKRCSGEYAFIMPCDAPNVSLEYIRWMMMKLTNLSFDKDVLVVKRTSGHIEPFNGFYSRKTIKAIELCIKQDINKITGIYNYVVTELVDEKLVKSFIEKDDIFRNLNTIEDIEAYYTINIGGFPVK